MMSVAKLNSEIKSAATLSSRQKLASLGIPVGGAVKFGRQPRDSVGTLSLKGLSNDIKEVNADVAQAIEEALTETVTAAVTKALRSWPESTGASKLAVRVRVDLAGERVFIEQPIPYLDEVPSLKAAWKRLLADVVKAVAESDNDIGKV